MTALPRGSPLVSVIVAAYRSDRRYLRQAIRSALDQNVREIEVIVTDDSPDDSLESVVRGEGDARCVYRRNRASLGPAANHAEGFRAARAPYLAILNHDDFWSSDFLASLVEKLEGHRDELVLAFCDHYVVDDHGQVDELRTEDASRVWGRSCLPEGIYRPFNSLMANQTIPLAMGAVFRADAVPPKQPRADSGPAYDLWLTYLLSRTGRGAYYVPRRLSSWRVHARNISGQRNADWAVGAAMTWRKVLGDPEMRSLHGVARKKAGTACQQVALARLGQRAGRALPWALSGLRYAPSAKAMGIVGACLLPSLLRRQLLGHFNRLRR